MYWSNFAVRSAAKFSSTLQSSFHVSIYADSVNGGGPACSEVRGLYERRISEALDEITAVVAATAACVM